MSKNLYSKFYAADSWNFVLKLKLIIYKSLYIDHLYKKKSIKTKQIDY